MGPETFLPVMYLATGAMMLVGGLGLLRRFGNESLHRVLAFMLFFGGLAPILAGIGLVQPSSSAGQIVLSGRFLDRFSYAWEFFFPTLLLFSLVFPQRRQILKRVRALPYLLYLPHTVHLLLILSARRGEPSNLFKSLESPPDFLTGQLGALDWAWTIGIALHELLFPAVNLAMGLTALVLLARNRELRRESTLRRQRLLLSLGFALPLTGYLIAEALPVFLGRAPSATVKPHLLSACIILSSGVIAYAAIRHRFLRIRILARRGMLDLSVSLLLAIVYLFILERFQSFFDTYLGNLASLFKAGLTVFAIVLFQPLLSRVEAILERRVLGHSGDPRREALRGFAAKVGDVSDRRDIESALAPVLHEAFHIDDFQLLEWEGPGEASERPDWFTALGAHRAELLQLQEVLPWRDFQAWCRQAELPEPPEHARFHHLLPLTDEAACSGLLLLAGRGDRRGLRAVDREHLVLLAGQTAAALRNLQLLRELLGKRILEEEMQLAQRIQLGLLPQRKPDIPSLRLHGTSLPSRQVGGDYFDWLVKGGDFYMIIGDVSGKGIPAAMLMATLQASFRAIARENRSPGELLAELNQIIYENSPPERFVTVWLGRMILGAGQLEYSSAGHPPPLLTRRGALTVPLQEGGTVLGGFPRMVFPTHRIPFGAGDRLVCFTDGVSETENSLGEQFSDRRLGEVLAQIEGEPERVIEDLLADLMCFSLTGEPDDDCTLLVLLGIDEEAERSASA